MLPRPCRNLTTKKNGQTRKSNATKAVSQRVAILDPSRVCVISSPWLGKFN